MLKFMTRKANGENPEIKRKDPYRRIKDMFSDPALYLGFGIQTAPIIAKYSGFDGDPKDVQSLFYGIGGAIVGTSLISYWLVKHYTRIRLDIEYTKLSMQEKNITEKFWISFKDHLNVLRDTDIQDLKHLIERGDKLLKNRDDKAAALRLADEAKGIIDRKCRLAYKKECENSDVIEVKPIKEKEIFLIPQKTYNHMSTNQQKRIQYFAEDIRRMINEDQIMQLYGELKKCSWNGDLTDMQTYMLFDDITLGLKDGIPSASKVENYVAKILEETSSK